MCIFIQTSQAQTVGVDRGYIERPCSFDLDGDGVIGEPIDDCNVGDGVTSDPDGDGVIEDIIYVDCQNGHDKNNDGTASSPYKTIEKAFDEADGPNDGAEDIIVFTGICNVAHNYRIPTGGVAGHYTKPKSNSESIDFQFPQDPLMLIGWDTDNDGEYPPYDTDDVSILDNSGGKTRTFRLNRGKRDNSYFEMAHLTVRNYGSGNINSGNAGFLDLNDNKSNRSHLYVHDIVLDSVNKDAPLHDNRIVIDMRNLSDYKHIAFININAIDNGGHFAKGNVGNENSSGFMLGEAGPIRFQNISYTAHACDLGSCAGTASNQKAAVKISELTGYVSDIEFLDSTFDANILDWTPRLEEEISPIGLGVNQCVENFTVRNNKIKNFHIVLPITSWSNSDCELSTRPVNVSFDRNEIEWDGAVDYHYSRVVSAEGDAGPSENRTTGNMTITNNMISTRGGERMYAAFILGVGNDGASQPGKILIANNTIHGDLDATSAAIKLLNNGGASLANDVEIRNNIISGLSFNDRNISLDYTPSGLVLDNNVYDALGRFQANTIINYNNLFAWQTNILQEANSQECYPNFIDPANQDFHLADTDICARDRGADLSSLFSHDYDNVTRLGNWDVGADQANVGCGDGVLEGVEVCDGGSLSCTTTAGYSGTQNCNSFCTGYDPCESTDFCGDALINGPEICDSESASCLTQDNYLGTQSCEATMCLSYDTCIATESCGDNVLNGNEICDGGDQTCSTVEGYLGLEDCNVTCDGYETCVASESCGDSTVNGPEVCDGGNQGCTTVEGYSGLQDCNGSCDGFGSCNSTEFCGDNIHNGPEVCDGGFQACVTAQGHAGLQDCNATCDGFEVCLSNEFCGDNIVNGAEICDGNSQSCTTVDNYAGTQNCELSCSAFDTCSPTEFCGDGVINGPEVCDSAGVTSTFIYVEAEDPTTTMSPFVTGYHEDASENGYIMAATGSGDYYNGANHLMVTYQVNVPISGDYYIWGRVLAQTSEFNSFYFQIDNNPIMEWSTATDPSWIWDAVKASALSGPATFNLSQGTHTIKIMVREDSTKLDKILLVDDLAHIPTGVGSNQNAITACVTAEGYLGTSSCNASCQIGACSSNEYCGDGVLNGNEQCDDGNAEGLDSCNNLCMLNIECNGSYIDPTQNCLPEDTEKHYLFLEAEYADSLITPFEAFADNTASGGECVEAPVGTGDHFGVGFSPVIATYTINVPEDGTYYLWGRVIALDPSQNSFFIQVDDQTEYEWTTNLYSSWQWNVASSVETAGAIPYQLTAGNHEFKLKVREDGTKIDKFLLTNDLSFYPSGEGGQSLPAPCEFTPEGCNPIPSGEAIYIEAEDADVMNYPFVELNDVNASNGKYIYPVPGSGNYFNGPSSIIATYTFTIDQAGDYYIHGRVLAETVYNNSFYIQVDGGSHIAWHLPINGNWLWDSIKSEGSNDPTLFTFSEGTHTIHVKSREEGTKIDRLLITDNLTYNP